MHRSALVKLLSQVEINFCEKSNSSNKYLYLFILFELKYHSGTQFYAQSHFWNSSEGKISVHCQIKVVRILLVQAALFLLV